MKHDNNGWTLIDLLCGVTATGIFALAALWSLSSVTRINQLAKVSADFLAMLDATAQMAASLGKDIAITFHPGESAVLIRFKAHESSTAAQLQKAYLIPEGISLEEARFGDIESGLAVLILRATGTATPGTIIFNDIEGKRCQITQALQGQRNMKCF